MIFRIKRILIKDNINKTIVYEYERDFQIIK